MRTGDIGRADSILRSASAQGEKRRPSLKWQGSRLISIRLEQFEKKASAVELLEALLELPSAEHLESLELVTSGRTRVRERHADYLRVLVKHPPARLMHLKLDWGGDADLRDLWAALPSLTHLEVRARWFNLGRIAHRALNEVSLVTAGRPPNGLSPANLKSLGNAKWPKVNRLSMRFGLSALTWMNLRLRQLTPILDGKATPALRTLELRQLVGIGDGVCDALVRSPMARRLERLELSDSDISDKGAALFEANRNSFPRLRFLGLERNLLSRKAQSSLANFCTTVDTSRQRRQPSSRTG